MSATASTVEVPDIGDFDDVPVIEILVSVGDTVAAEDPLVTLESDKATMDVPAPYAGVVEAISVKIGDRVAQGTPLMTIAGESAPELDEPAAEDAPAPEDDAAAPEPPPSSTEPSTSPQPSPADATPRSNGDDPEFGRQAELARPGAAGPELVRPGEAGPIYASPSARRVARELGVDLRRVSGSGRKGRITREDVQAAAESPGSGPRTAPGAATSRPDAATSTGLDLLPWPTVDFEKFGPVERVPRSRIQRISAPNLARNWVMIPHVTQNDEADVTELEAWRKQLNSEQGEVKVTMVSFLVVAAVVALRQFPNFNSSLDGDELVLKRYYNIGFAADTPGGLVVPVIKGADTKGLLEIAADLTALSGKAREGKLSSDDMRGATFTISSLGGIGGTSFTPIINAPEVAILGATRSAMKPLWNGSEFVPRLMLPLSLSYDHRVIDGAAAARFTAFLARVLSDLRRALL